MEFRKPVLYNRNLLTQSMFKKLKVYIVAKRKKEAEDYELTVKEKKMRLESKLKEETDLEIDKVDKDIKNVKERLKKMIEDKNMLFNKFKNLSNKETLHATKEAFNSNYFNTVQSNVAKSLVANSKGGHPNTNNDMGTANRMASVRKNFPIDDGTANHLHKLTSPTNPIKMTSDSINLAKTHAMINQGNSNFSAQLGQMTPLQYGVNTPKGGGSTTTYASVVTQGSNPGVSSETHAPNEAVIKIQANLRSLQQQGYLDAGEIQQFQNQLVAKVSYNSKLKTVQHQQQFRAVQQQQQIQEAALRGVRNNKLPVYQNNPKLLNNPIVAPSSTSVVSRTYNDTHVDYATAALLMQKKIANSASNNTNMITVCDALPVNISNSAASAVSSQSLPPAAVGYRGSITTGQSAQQIQLNKNFALSLQQQQQKHSQAPSSFSSNNTNVGNNNNNVS